MSQIMDFLVQTSCVSSDLLKEIMRDYLSGKKQKSGLKSFNKLAKTGVLESIEITDNNIKDFLSTAKKYDIDFALTRDKSTSPPTYRIFFQSGKEENFQKQSFSFCLACCFFGLATKFAVHTALLVYREISALRQCLFLQISATL